jgi:hypothetical protein
MTRILWTTVVLFAFVAGFWMGAKSERQYAVKKAMEGIQK